MLNLIHLYKPATLIVHVLFFFIPDPIKHFYFWLKHSEGSICWSRLRENANRNSQRAIVFEVHQGPSQSIKKNPSYSPGDLHKHVFWVLTGGGVLDLFAYNEDAYGMWLENISSLASKNAKRGIENLSLKKQSRINSRPSSTLSHYSRATVAPVNHVTNDASTSLSSTLTFDPNLSPGEVDSLRDGNVATGSSLYDQGDSRSDIDGKNKFSIFNRSLSVPVHLLPLTSTPQDVHAHNRVLTSPEDYARGKDSLRGGLQTPTSVNPKPSHDDNDII